MTRLALLLALLLGGCVAGPTAAPPGTIQVSGDDRGIGGTGAPRSQGAPASTATREGTGNPAAASMPPSTPAADAETPASSTNPGKPK